MTAVAADAPGGVKAAKPAPIDKTSIPDLQRIPLTELHESPLNRRERYDELALEQLSESLLASGQLTPIIVRPRTAPAGGYEIAAGHRRYRAAKRACTKSPEGAAYRGLDRLAAVVRVLDDKTFIEVLNIENLQRDDLHPYEEAQGFRDLMERAGYDVAKIAARVGRSVRYVYDSLTLLKLIPKARKMFLADAFERGHAIELARLSPDWQERAIGTENAESWRHDGLFQAEHVEVESAKASAQESLDLEDAVKPVSIREFKTWVNEKVRARPAETDPMLFPDTVAQLKQATADKEKVIEITYDHQLPDEARDPEYVGKDVPKVYGAQAWRSATKGYPSPGYGKVPGDGKPCDHSVLGVIVIGQGRGEAFQVCIAKEKCKTHWGDWQRARAKRQKQSSGSSRPARDNYAEQQERYRREEAKRTEERARWKKAQPAILKAVATKIAAMPAGASSDLADEVLKACLNGKPAAGIARGRTLEDLVRYAAFQLYAHDVSELLPGYYRSADALKSIRALGINADKIVDQVSRKPTTEKKKAAKKKAKRGA